MSGNLFSNLLALHPSHVPEEDFFTEVIAWLLDKNPDILLAWLKTCLKIDSSYPFSSVVTQATFAKLEGHDRNSRPDILITLSEGEESEVIVVESKVGSYEGYEQLPRYAEQLEASYPNAKKRHLVYITREYDPKEAGVITRRVKNEVVFHQLRWHEFYSFLRKQHPSPLLEEILSFMRSKNMAEITHITPTTLVGFCSFIDVYQFYETVLKGDISDQLRKTLNQKPQGGVEQYNYRRHIRYVSGNGWWLLVGFWMPDALDKFPKIAVQFQVASEGQSQKRCAELADILKQVEKDSAECSLKWVGANLDSPRSYPSLELHCSFNEILPEGDHVAAIKRRFGEFLGDAKRVIEQYPGLLTPQSGK